MKSLGGGATLDIGFYCAQFASLVMGGERPLKIAGSGHLNSEVRNKYIYYITEL